MRTKGRHTKISPQYQQLAEGFPEWHIRRGPPGSYLDVKGTVPIPCITLKIKVGLEIGNCSLLGTPAESKVRSPVLKKFGIQSFLGFCIQNKERKRGIFYSRGWVGGVKISTFRNQPKTELSAAFIFRGSCNKGRTPYYKVVLI